MSSAPITLGLLRLTDAAPVIIAREKGWFAAADLDVRLSVEPSWANIADKLTYRHLDGAVMLPPLALATSLGLRGAGMPLIVPMSLSLNGNAVTVTPELAEALTGDGDCLDLGRRLARRRSAARLRFAVVHAFSTHDLLLRYWLIAAGIDPDREVELVTIPPASMVEALAEGRIEGFCAGAPWGAVAAEAGLGRTILKSREIWHNHPEKCLALRRAWAEREPEALTALLACLLDAAQFCDRPENADEIAGILADEAYLDLDPALIRASLPGALSSGCGEVDRSVFFAENATFPWRSQAGWFLAKMTAYGQLPPSLDRAAAAIYRPDLYRIAAAQRGLPTPDADTRIETGFCDGATFDMSAQGIGD